MNKTVTQGNAVTSEATSVPLMERAALTPPEISLVFGKSRTWGYKRIYDETFRPIKGLAGLMVPVSQIKEVLSRTEIYSGKEAV